MVTQEMVRYCRYQERCHKEVRTKLLSLGLRGLVLEQAIAELVEKDLINEVRFAKAFARGKFRMKQWGRVKITQELKKRGVSQYCIAAGLREIPNDAYRNTLTTLLNKKKATLTKERNGAIVKAKLYKFLLQKGFEGNLVQDSLASFPDEADS